MVQALAVVVGLWGTQEWQDEGRQAQVRFISEAGRAGLRRINPNEQRAQSPWARWFRSSCVYATRERSLAGDS